MFTGNSVQEESAVISDLVEVSVTSQAEHGTRPEGVTPHLQLTCFEMLSDTIKATKKGFDPVSDGCGAFLGCICCVVVAVGQAKEDNRPATRRDVRRGRATLQRQHDSELGTGYDIGFCLANAAVDTLSSGLGFFVGIPRATILTCTGNNDRSNTVLGFSREQIEEVDLTDSCMELRNCMTDCFS